MAQLTVDVPEIVFMVSRTPALAWAYEPEYENFARVGRLELLDIFKSTSVSGPSYAKVKFLSSASPDDFEVNPENAADYLWIGDRVAIGQQLTGKIRWLFSGYVTVAAITIDQNGESLIYKISGPEYQWGETPGGGAEHQIFGQCRRLAAADDAYKADPAKISKFEEWDVFTSYIAEFNPDGRKNMAATDVILTQPPQKEIKGRIWEEPDRLIGGVSKAESWNMRQAAKMLCTFYNDPEITGIGVPEKWDDGGFILRETDVLPPMVVQGTGLYDALRRICGSKYGFYIDPVPTKVTGKKWEGMQLIFFSRAEGGAADFVLNKRGTSMRKAAASVFRLEAARDVQKAVSTVIVRARYVRPIKLVFWGGYTKTATDVRKRIALQPAWVDTDGNLNDFHVNNTITEVAIDSKDDATRKKWRDRYVTSGEEFQKYDYVFRTFVWNEANELPLDNLRYSPTITNVTLIPDLTGIADVPEVPGAYMRRRRAMLDTHYLRNGTVDEWTRVKPTLFMAVASAADSDKFNDLKWRRISDAAYNIDPIRCAFTLTADDLAKWAPFRHQDTGEPEPEKRQPQDLRTFATLLHQGVLRMCIECSIETDNAMEKLAPRSAECGTPFIRERIIDAPTFIKTLLPYADGLAANVPTKLPPFPVDKSAAAQTYAEMNRDAGQEMQTHASVMTSGDWPEQKLGSMIATISGRNINMTGPSNRGAQIVAARLDPRNMKWEYLTESLALAITEKDRKQLSRARILAQGKRDAYREFGR